MREGMWTSIGSSEFDDLLFTLKNHDWKWAETDPLNGDQQPCIAKKLALIASIKVSSRSGSYIVKATQHPGVFFGNLKGCHSLPEPKKKTRLRIFFIMVWWFSTSRYVNRRLLHRSVTVISNTLGVVLNRVRPDLTLHSIILPQAESAVAHVL